MGISAVCRASVIYHFLPWPLANLSSMSRLVGVAPYVASDFELQDVVPVRKKKQNVDRILASLSGRVA